MRDGSSGRELLNAVSSNLRSRYRVIAKALLQSAIH